MRATVSVPGGARGGGFDLQQLSATPIEEGIQVSWEFANEQVVSYSLYRATEPETHSMMLKEEVSATASAYLDGDVKPGETFYYWVETVTQVGLGVLHGPVRATLPSMRLNVPVVSSVPANDKHHCGSDREARTMAD
jgi:hypothetical protein